MEMALAQGLDQRWESDGCKTLVQWMGNQVQRLLFYDNVLESRSVLADLPVNGTACACEGFEDFECVSFRSGSYSWDFPSAFMA